MAAGRLPFEGKDKPEIKKNITANNLAGFPSFLTPQASGVSQASYLAQINTPLAVKCQCANSLRDGR